MVHQVTLERLLKLQFQRALRQFPSSSSGAEPPPRPGTAVPALPPTPRCPTAAIPPPRGEQPPGILQELLIGFGEDLSRCVKL
jgi:hypothetical protein